MRHDFAFIKSNKRLIKLRFDEVVFIKGLGNYVEIAISSGEKYVYYRSLKELINTLPEDFMRIHNSYIVNLAHVDSFEDNHITLKNLKIRVPKSYKDCVDSAIAKIML
mgnify:CR=1 FL=1